MDQDLIVFLERHFAAIDQRFTALEQRMEERLSSLEQRMDQRFEQVDRRFEQVDRRFEQVDQRFEQVDRRFEQVDQRFEQVDQRFEQVDQRFEQVDQRFDKVEDSVNGSYILTEELRGTISLVAEGVDGLREQMERQGKDLLQRIEESDSFHRQAYEALEVRVQKLEAAKRVQSRRSGPRKA